MSMLRRAGVCSLLAVSIALGLGTQARADTPLPVASYTLSVNGPMYYGYEDSGGQLTDGQFGMTVGGGYWNWAPYVLWDGASPQITFDLGTSRSVGRIEGQFLTYPKVAVYLPQSAQVSFSEDGLNYSAPVSQALYTLGTPLAKDQPVALSLLASPGQGRYVRVLLETPGRWFALSEVSLFAPVPEPGSLALAVAGLAMVGVMARSRTASR